MGIISDAIETVIVDTVGTAAAVVVGGAVATVGAVAGTVEKVFEKPIARKREKKQQMLLEEDEALIQQHLSSFPGSKMLLFTRKDANFIISDYNGESLFTAQFEWFKKGFSDLRRITVRRVSGEYAGSITECLPKQRLFGPIQSNYFTVDISGRQVGCIYNDHLDYLGLWYGPDVIEGAQFNQDDTVYSSNSRVIGKIIIKSCKTKAGMVWSKFSQNDLILVLLALSKMITWWYIEHHNDYV